jgi:SAM-dependent methyltransferase
MRTFKQIPLSYDGKIVQERIDEVYQQIDKADKVLDLGTATGKYVKELRRRGIDAFGIDIVPSPEWKNESGRNEAFLVANASNLPFGNKTFDVAISFEVLEHVANIEDALAELHRCVKKKIVISVPNCDLDNSLRKYDLAMAHWTDRSHCNFFTEESLQELLVEQGFRILKVKKIYRVSPNSYFWDTIKLPRKIANIGKYLCKKYNLVETYWSSILVVAEVVDLG